jgi:hypothetical protein
MGMINDHAALDGVEIGQIDIQNNFAFFEVDKSLADEVIPAFRGKDLDGLKLSVEPSTGKSGGPEDKSSHGDRSDRSDRGDRRPSRDGDRRSGGYGGRRDSDRSDRSDRSSRDRSDRGSFSRDSNRGDSYGDRSRAKSKSDYRKKSSDFNKDSDSSNSDEKAERRKNRKW